MAIAQFLVVLALAMIGTLPIILGDIFLKISADAGKTFSWYTLLGGIAYFVSAPIWNWLMMKNVDLTQVGILFTSMTLVGLAGVGLIWFGENLTLGRVIAIILVLIAIPVSEYVK